MGKNPLIGDGDGGRGPNGPSASGIDLKVHCQRLNFNFKWVRRLPRWYYVEPGVDGRPSAVTAVDGPVAESVWTILDGKKIDYRGWAPADLMKVERRARWLIAQGTTEAAQ